MRRSCCTASAMRPPRKRRTYASPKRATPKITQEQEPRPERTGRVGQDVVDDDLLDQRRERGDPGADDRDAERGDRIALVRRDPRDQPPDPTLLSRSRIFEALRAHCCSVRVVEAGAEDRVHLVEAVHRSAARSSTASTRGSRRSAIAASAVSSALVPLGGDAEPDRPAVAVHRFPGQVAPLREPVHDRAHARLGDREPPGQQRCPLVTGRDHGQHPVLGQASGHRRRARAPGPGGRWSGRLGAGRPFGEPLEW